MIRVCMRGRGEEGGQVSMVQTSPGNMDSGTGVTEVCCTSSAILQNPKPHFIQGRSQVVWTQHEHLTTECQVTVLCAVHGISSHLTRNVFTLFSFHFKGSPMILALPPATVSSHWNPEP